jgi:hypothetical protein
MNGEPDNGSPAQNAQSRVGRVSIPVSKAKPEFVLKPTGDGRPGTELPPNPVVERFREPLPPTPLERMLPVIKGMTVGLAVMILLLVAIYFTPLPGAGDAAAVARAGKALRTVKALPTQHAPLVMLKEATLPLRNTADADLVAALLAVLALGEVRTGDRTTGLRQCEYVASVYSNSPAATLVRSQAISEPCRKCKGTGRVPEGLKPAGNVAAMDSDTVTCLGCHGKGTVLSDAAVDAQYAKALTLAEERITTDSRNGAVLSFLLRLQRGLHRAFGRDQSVAPTQSATSPNTPR